MQLIYGQRQISENPLGADFIVTVQAVQSVSKSFQDFKKIPQQKVLAAFGNFISFIQVLEASPFFSKHEKDLFLSKAQKILNSGIQRSIPLGPSLIYGSRSSPLLRMIPVLNSLSQQCPVILLCSPATVEAYIFFCEKLIACGIPPSSIGILSTKDPEALETLISHPALKSIHFHGHAYEGDFLKKSPLPLFQKRIKIHLGSKNPVIFTHDAELSSLEAVLMASLQSSYLSEHRFHRWFVQEKNYSLFIEKIEAVFPFVMESLSKQAQTDLDYTEALKNQNISLFKEKNWRQMNSNSFFLNSDFNNCSPWHQQETLGSLLTITRYKNSAEAIKFANTTQYACAAAVFSSTSEKAKELAAQLTMPHRFQNEVPDLGTIDAVLGLPGCGFGNEIPDTKFFSF